MTYSSIFALKIGKCSAFTSDYLRTDLDTTFDILSSSMHYLFLRNAIFALSITENRRKRLLGTDDGNYQIGGDVLSEPVRGRSRDYDENSPKFA